MPVLRAERVEELLLPYTACPLKPEAMGQLQRYLDVFSRWSVRTNLSTIIDPEQVVQRHFGEGFVLAQSLHRFHSLLDLGSGAGFPGIPVSVMLPQSGVVLAESQQKKAAFLREAVWEMGINASVWADRAEKLVDRQQFDVVALRAVDGMSRMLAVARSLLRPAGSLAFFTGERQVHHLPGDGWDEERRIAVPNSAGELVIARLAP